MIKYENKAVQSTVKPLSQTPLSCISVKPNSFMDSNNFQLIQRYIIATHCPMAVTLCEAQTKLKCSKLWNIEWFGEATRDINILIKRGAGQEASLGFVIPSALQSCPKGTSRQDYLRRGLYTHMVAALHGFPSPILINGLYFISSESPGGIFCDPTKQAIFFKRMWGYLSTGNSSISDQHCCCQCHTLPPHGCDPYRQIDFLLLQGLD